MAFTLSAVASKALDEAEPKYQANHYGEALMIYRDALTHDPDCYVLHMNAGDCYLFSGNPLAALASYDRALELNRSDFHAHWYRGSALLELDRRAEARASYARALALSPRQGNLIQSINNRSDRLGFRARGDLFHPLAVARHEGDTFNIYSVDSTHWWIYGLCRAIWLAEAGHRKNLTGREGHGWTNTEELECTANLLVSYRTDRDSGKSPAEPELDHLLEVLDAHRLGAFVDYEFGSRVAGDYSVLLDRDAQDRLVEFVDRFVFEPVATGH
jgi:tetratricopeptide (TPR) repeat protein